MQKVKWLGRGVLLLGVVVLSGCAEVRTQVAETPTKPMRVETAPAPRKPQKVVPLSASIQRELSEYDNDIGVWADAMLRYGRYDELDQAAAHWRSSRERYSNGNWKLTAIYNGLSQVTSQPNAAKMRLDKMREWVAQKPQSITARVTLAKTLANIARAVFIESRSKDLKKSEADFGKRLNEIDKILLDAQKLPEKCPQWWVEKLRVATGYKIPLDSYDRLLEKAITFEPDYLLFYANKVIYLMYRGEEERKSVERYTRDAADKKGGDEGDILYALLINIVYDDDYEFLEELGASYERIDNGYLLLTTRDPNDVGIRVAWARLCRWTGNSENEAARKKRALEIIAQMPQLDPSEAAPWRRELQEVRNWALSSEAMN